MATVYYPHSVLYNKNIMNNLSTAIKSEKEQSYDVISGHVDGNIKHLTLSALSSALGDIRVLKLDTTAKSSAKYTIITDPEEIVLALEYISRFSNTLLTPQALEQHEQEYSYFILQQSPINMSAWNSLIDRRLGKIPQEAKIEASIQFDLVQAGIRAYQQKSTTPQDLPTYTIPKIHTTQ